MNTWGHTAGAVVAAILTSASAAPAVADEDWEYELAPYLWAAGLKGDALIRGQPVEVDQSFSDLFDALEIGGGLLMRAERGHWVLWTQADYFALSTSELDDPPERGKLDVDMTLLTVGFGREFESSNGRRSLDVLLGARYLDLEGTLKFPTLGTFKNGDSFTDPLIILRPSFQISERWRLNPTFSYGTGGDSESTYELQPQVQFQMNDRWTLRFGYRKVHYDIERDASGNKFDASFHGPILGISGMFGGSLEPVAAPPPPPPVAKPTPPPPPPPPPAPPPGDGDKDGVADDKDRCPNTRAGIQVDAIGCFREFTLRGVLFDTDSSELSAAARTELDAVVAAYKQLPADVAAGVKVSVEGHTDNTGSDAYNQGLSERRAGAVGGYLTEAGVAAGIVSTKGYGEASPTDSNDSAEGRANNRRVVIKATR